MLSLFSTSTRICFSTEAPHSHSFLLSFLDLSLALVGLLLCTKMWLFLFLKEKGCHMFAGSDLIGQWCYYLPPLVNQSILSVFCYVIMSRQLFNYCEQTTFWRGLKHYALGFGANAAQKINSYSFYQEQCDMEIFFSVRRLVLPQIQNFLGGNGRGHGPSKRQLRDCGFS